jgi:hypothetical protein
LKFIKQLLGYLVGLIGLLSFYIPSSLQLEWKIAIAVGGSTIYFLVMNIIIQRKYDSTVNKLAENGHKVSELEKKLILYEEFIHNRKLFKSHDLKKINKLTYEYHSFVMDKYRGHKFNDMVSESRILKGKIEEIIDKEERDFDDQLYKIPSNKNNR